MPTNQILRTLCECAQIQIQEALLMPEYQHLRDIYEKPYTQIYGAFCE